MKWYKRDPDAFKGGTLGLTLEEIGAYTLLLDDIYARGGSVPDNIWYLVRLWRCRPQRAHRLRRSLIRHGKLSAIENTLQNGRANLEFTNINKQFHLPVHKHKRHEEKTQQNQRKNAPRLKIQDTEYPLKGYSVSCEPKGENGNLARSLPLDALARSPTGDLKMKKYEYDRAKAEMVTKPDGSRILRNIATPTTTKPKDKDGKQLKIEVDPITGIPTLPGSDQPAWEPKFDSRENLLDCRPPWDRKKDLDYRGTGRFQHQEVIAPGQITWAEVPQNTKQPWPRLSDDELRAIYPKAK